MARVVLCGTDWIAKWLLVAGFLVSLGVLPSARAGVSEQSGLFVISERGRYGYIDATGTVVIKPVFQDAGPFSEGLAPVCVEGRYGYIDSKGEFVVAPSYRRAYPFSEGLGRIEATKADGETGIGFIDRTGRVIIQPRFNFADDFHEGLALVEAPDDYSFCYIDTRGAYAFKGRFASAERFTSGRAAVIVGSKEGYIDRSGQFVVEAPRSTPIGARLSLFLHPFSEGLTRWCVNGVYGFIDIDGAWAIEPRFEDAGPFIGGAALVKIGGKWGLIDTKGTFLAECVYDHVGSGIFHRQYRRVKLNGKLGALSPSGELLFATDARYLGTLSEGLAYVSDGIKYGYVDMAGKICIPLTFDRAGSFRGGLARVVIGDHIAYVNRDGAIVWSSPSCSTGEWIFSAE